MVAANNHNTNATHNIVPLRLFKKKFYLSRAL